MPQPKQTTMVSRSFGAEVRDYDELANAIPCSRPMRRAPFARPISSQPR